MSDSAYSQNTRVKLPRRMSELGVKEADIIESFVRAQGPGGQKVNKSSTCVYLKHIPTGIEVKCQVERSQALNRVIARELLLRKIENSRLNQASREKQRIEKIKRQKRIKPYSLKQKILEEKRKHSRKKRLRSKAHLIES